MRDGTQALTSRCQNAPEFRQVARQVCNRSRYEPTIRDMHHGTKPRPKRAIRLEFQHAVAARIATQAGATNSRECAAFWGLTPTTWSRLKRPERFGTSGEVAAAVLLKQPILFSQVVKPVVMSS